MPLWSDEPAEFQAQQLAAAESDGLFLAVDTSAFVAHAFRLGQDWPVTSFVHHDYVQRGAISPSL